MAQVLFSARVPPGNRAILIDRKRGITSGKICGLLEHAHFPVSGTSIFLDGSALHSGRFEHYL